MGLAHEVTICDKARMSEHLIDRLGGNKAVADALGTTINVVANWRTREIPWKRRPAIARLASSQAVALPVDFWDDDATRPTPDAQAAA